jgi:transmembrane 9 superfamily protein 2/4
MLGRLLSCAVLLTHLSSSFYLPGVAPTEFHQGDAIPIKVKELTSDETQLPMDYYSLPFCKPLTPIIHYAENLGEILSGETIENSPYVLYKDQTERCQVLCVTDVGTDDYAQNFINRIRQNYRVNMVVDNLPAAIKYQVQSSDPKAPKVCNPHSLSTCFIGV